jgi:lipopolysaccharide heptosyltransferase I
LNPSWLPKKRFERIFLIKPSAVGDVIHTLPVLVKLRARYPDARIDWLLTPAIAELVRHQPALSNVVLFHRHCFSRLGRSWCATTGFFRLLSAIREARYDLVIDLHGQFRSALFTWASGAPVRIGFDRPQKRRRGDGDRRLVKEAYRHGWTGAREGAWIAYSHRIAIPRLDVHAVDRYLWLAPLLGLDEGPADFQLHVPSEAKARVERLLTLANLRARPFAVLVPGTMWETKHWLVERFVEVGRHLQRSGLGVVLAGSTQERPRGQAVAAACPGAYDLCGQTTLPDLAALLQKATVSVTNDSGPMHLAVALRRPVVSVFGPTDPIWIGPYGQPDAVVRADVPCAPCYLRMLRLCPHGHACMNEVPAEAVIERVDRILRRTLVA